MTGDLAYAYEKFSCAVHAMATSEGTLRERVLEARVHLSPVAEEDLPSDALRDYRTLLARMTWAEPKADEGTIAATFALISDAEVRQLARLICDVHARIEHAMIDRGKGGPKR